MPNITEVFEQIIRYQSTEELVPFLLALDKQEVLAIRKRTQTLAHELADVRQQGEQHWEKGPTQLQQSLFFLTGLATYSQKEALAPDFARSLWVLNRSSFSTAKNEFLPPPILVEYACQLLGHRRPEWLDVWLGNTADSRSLSGLSFDLLLKLEHRGLIVPSDKLLAISGVSELSNYGTEAKTLWQLHGYVKANVKLTNSQTVSYAQLTKTFAWLREGEPLPFIQDLVFERVARNKVLLERAVPLFFEVDTEINWGFMHAVDQGVRQWLAWYDILARLVATNHLDRADILSRCLLALRRDFRRPLLTWFRELFLALKPTFTERLARQEALTELLAHPQALVVNFALEQLKDLLPEPGFDLAPLLLSAGESLLARPDLKTGLRTFVTVLAKLPYRAGAWAPAVASLLAAALAHPDAAVQERAAKGLAELLSAKKPLLSPAQTTAVLATLAQQAELLGPAARTALAPWLAPPPEPISAPATYAPLAQFVPDISPATAIAPVADWYELLFLTGQVLQHDDPAARERWLDGLLRLHKQLPAGYATQLQPYLVQVVPQLKKASAAETAALLAGPLNLHGHQGLLQALLLGWASGFATPRVGSVQLNQGHGAPTPLLALEQQRYLLAETRLRTATALPLLSTPTHRPHWVAPTELVSRLLAYQAAGSAPSAADLAVALARAAHAHPAEAAQARRLLPQLADAGLRELLAWFFGPANQPLPALAPASGRPAAHFQTTIADALPELWAVAARTKAPADAFPTLAASLGYDHPGLTQPLPATCEAVPRENHYPDPSQPTQEAVYRFVELAWSSGATRPAPSPLLLYAPPVGKSQRGDWESNWLLAGALPHLAALLPSYAAPLYAHVLRCAAWADNLESTKRDLLLLALRTLLGPGPVLDVAATAVLASGLLHHSPQGRHLAQEVLLQAIAHGRLQPAALGQVLGQQLATGYAPAPRLADNLLPIRGIDALTDDALRQVLDALLPTLPAVPPRNTRKLLDTYAALLARTRRPLPAVVRPHLLAWQQTASLKPAAKALLALPEPAFQYA